MAKRKGNYKAGPGRPKSVTNGDPLRVNVYLLTHQVDYVKAHFGSLSAGIRHLIDQAMTAEEAADSAENSTSD
ncbi:MAG: hypothetical protein M9930_20010 [Anaerolineae bacterium]|nr:hypothetical protein [Anaerolineae bacterium]